MHLSPNGYSALPEILSRAGRLPASHPRHGEHIEAGRIYVAPPDHHLLVKRGHVSLPVGPRENGYRPAIDPLFRTAARAYGARVNAVVLSGALDDGTAGLAVVKERGGIAVAQDPADASYPSMPSSAVENVEVDHIAASREIGPLLARLAGEETTEGGGFMTEDELDAVELDLDTLRSLRPEGAASGFTCPECNGALWEENEGDVARFRCRVGHGYTSESLLAAQVDALEAALWSGLRALEERAAFCRSLAQRLERRGNTRSAQKFIAQADDAESRAVVIRDALASTLELNRKVDVADDSASGGVQGGQKLS